MNKNYYNTTKKTSSSLAIEDVVFRELFGSIWHDTGFVLENNNDYAWAELYKDFILKALDDWVNPEYTKISKVNYNLATCSLEKWLKEDSPFNNYSKVKNIKSEILSRLSYYEIKYKENPSKLEKIKLKAEKFLDNLKTPDYFEFKFVCSVVGLSKKEAIKKFEFYHNLKTKHRHNVRIVKRTFGKFKGEKGITKPCVNLENIKNIRFADYLHPDFNREARDRKMKRLGIKVIKE